jgi:hypothetical protein
MPRAAIISAIISLALSTPAAAQWPTGPQPLAGGGDVTLREQQGVLHVTVSGPRAGLASLCVGDDTRVRILHASAAVGEAAYDRSGNTWALTSKFDFKLRDARTGPPTEQEHAGYFSTMGWVANASRAGDAKREFRIRLSDAVQFVGVTFFTTNEPMTVSYWPASMADDCRAVKVAQGFLPETADFRPSTWQRVR